MYHPYRISRQPGGQELPSCVHARINQRVMVIGGVDWYVSPITCAAVVLEVFAEGRLAGRMNHIHSPLFRV